jgi:hypothetical protein
MTNLSLHIAETGTARVLIWNSSKFQEEGSHFESFRSRSPPIGPTALVPGLVNPQRNQIQIFSNKVELNMSGRASIPVCTTLFVGLLVNLVLEGLVGWISIRPEDRDTVCRPSALSEDQSDLGREDRLSRNLEQEGRKVFRS